LNISDFTRYATSQKAQIGGQAIGLPFFMAGCGVQIEDFDPCSKLVLPALQTII
jgi:hypothetical protein